MGGYDGCNSFFGKYKTDGDKIILTSIGTTLMKCPKDRRLNPGGVFSIEGANRFEIKDGTLNLYKDARLLLTFEGQEKPPK